MGYETRTVEKRIAELFSECKPFSEHLVKWEDKDLPDKYDHNCFEYCGQPTREEFVKAIQYQKRIGADFIKLEGDAPLSDSFGLEESITLTMILKGNGKNWKTNPDLEFRTPPINELEELEVKHFGPLYGEDFTRRNIRRLYEKLTYYGAYLNGVLAGACYSFCDDGLTCIDGLIVDEKYRKMHIATSLIARIKRDYPETILFLHADEEDIPKKIYEKMGFETADKLFEYDLAKGVKAMGAQPLNFEAFDTEKIDEYAAQAKASWGHTEAYKEFEKKTEGRSKKETLALSREMMEIFAEIGEIKDKDPASKEAAELVEKLQSFITEHFYTCTKEILKGLGMMYAAPGEKAENIDQYGGKGTAAFAAKAIEEYCKKA